MEHVTYGTKLPCIVLVFGSHCCVQTDGKGQKHTSTVITYIYIICSNCSFCNTEGSGLTLSKEAAQ